MTPSHIIFTKAEWASIYCPDGFCLHSQLAEVLVSKFAADGARSPGIVDISSVSETLPQESLWSVKAGLSEYRGTIRKKGSGKFV
jgi:hypothetical protein